MTVLIILGLATAFLAYSNGANDNFKGVATVYGSGTAGYSAALGWATVTTFAGSVASLFLARSLIDRFSGNGLVPDAVAISPEFMLAVGAGASLTVFAASLLGFPISTTHSLTGALVGSGLVAVGADINVGVLGGAFVLPLLASPVIAAGSSGIGYLGLDRVWWARTAAPVAPGTPSGWGVHVRSTLDVGHFLSAGTVSFARGLNDTPKVVALLLVVDGFELRYGVAVVAIAMAAGGLVHARAVAEVMSKRITSIGKHEGLVANLVTGVLVIFASRFGLPVSTTHVAVGSIFGIGAAKGKADKAVISSILLSWILTLPAAAVLSAIFYGVIGMLG